MYSLFEQQFFVCLKWLWSASIQLGPLSYCFLPVQDKVEKQGKDEAKLWETMLLGLRLHNHASLLMWVLASWVVVKYLVYSFDQSDHFLRNGIVKGIRVNGSERIVCTWGSAIARRPARTCKRTLSKKKPGAAMNQHQHPAIHVICCQAAIAPQRPCSPGRTKGSVRCGEGQPRVEYWGDEKETRRDKVSAGWASMFHNFDCKIHSLHSELAQERAVAESKDAQTALSSAQELRPLSWKVSIMSSSIANGEWCITT